MNNKKDFSKVITFDGTSGSGKGTIAKKIAKHYDYVYLDTGKLYRALASLINTDSNDLDYINKLEILVKKITPQLLASSSLYDEKITLLASKIAENTQVRKALFSFQRDFVLCNDGVVLDGRDTGSVICPEAMHKFYIDADLTVRAKRRYLQNKNFYDNANLNISAIKSSLYDRDQRDKKRKIAPLMVPQGANIIDNSNDNLDDVIKKIIDIIDY